jgi:heavy metal sensor kinase
VITFPPVNTLETGRARSFRLQLALRLANAFTATLLVIALAIHVSLKTILLQELDKSLSSVASVQAGAIAQSPADDMRLHEWRLSPQEAKAVRDVNWFIQLWDSQGRSPLRSGYLDRDLPLDSAALRRAGAGELVYLTQADDVDRLRVLYYPIERIDPRHAGHVLEVASSIAPLAQTMRRIDIVLAVLAIVGIAGVSAGGWLLAGHALKPVAQITQQAEGIEAGSLGQRITAHARTAEFQGLVAVLNRMLDRLDAAFEAQKRFVADASHELRSPIAAVRGHLEVVRRRERSTAQYEEAIDVALQEVHRLQALASDLLTLARRDAGVLEVRMRRVRLTEVVCEIAASHQALAQAKGLTLNSELASDVIVAGDADLLRRLVRNLLDNAIKFTPSGGEVSLRVGHGTGTAWVEVADTGSGIAPEHLPHLFDRFYRADLSRDRSSGTGLGLAIAQAIANAHGGQLRVHNRPEGGATFRFETILLIT